MKIRSIEAVTCKVPLPRPLELGNLHIAQREYVLVTIETDEGLQGVGYGMTRDTPVAAVVRRNLAPLLLAGGGLKMGQVIGQSSRNGGEPNSEAIRNKHLISTIMHTLFDVGQLRVTRGMPREILTMAESEPIPGLI